MATAMQVGSKVIQTEEVPSLLQRYQLISQVLRGLVIDQAIADITCTQDEHLAAITEFENQRQITTPEARSVWLHHQAMTSEQMEEIAIRPLKIEKFKVATWGHKIGSYFLARKASLDQVMYSLIRTKDAGLAHELYFRIHEGEQSFAELAQKYSQGTEASTGGLLGPVSLAHPHPIISKLLSVSQPGQLWPPRMISEWLVIVRLEKIFPAQLDEPTRCRLIDELFETWLQEQIKEIEP